jgi:predicted small integral membrane protein
LVWELKNLNKLFLMFGGSALRTLGWLGTLAYSRWKAMIIESLGSQKLSGLRIH